MKNLSRLIVLLASGVLVGAAFAEESPVSVAHTFVNLVQLEDGLEVAEYEFTVTNNGGTNLNDLRFSFGLHAPEPVSAEGEPTMRIEALAAGESTIVYWQVSMSGASSEMLSDSDLIGWVEAIDTDSEDIISFPLTSASQGGAQ